MSKKINNKTLLIVFLSLTALLIITKLFTSRKSERTLDTELVQIDTAGITEMLLYPQAENGEEIVFTKKGSDWTIMMNEVTGPADHVSIRRSLSELMNLKTERLVARTGDRWKEFNVDDSLGTRLIIKEGKKKTLDLVIGRFEYQPPPGGYQGYGQNQFSGNTYVRKTSDEEVYAVQGFLALNFNQNFNTWRDQSLSNFSPSQITKIVFDYPADSGFIAQKSETGWLVGGLPADSASMAEYISNISRKRSSAFEDGFHSSSPPDYQLTLEGENMTPIHIRAFTQPQGDVILNSSINPSSWFRSSMDDLFADIYKRAEDLLLNESSNPK